VPIINVPSPWSAASDAIGGYVDERNKQADTKKRDEQQQFLNQRSINSEQFEAQRAALEQKRFDEDHRRNLVNEESDKVNLAINQATLEHNKATWPIADAISKANLAGKLDENMRQKATFAAGQADDAFFKKVYGMTGDQAVTVSKLKEAQASIAAKAAQQAHEQAATQQGWAHVGIAQQNANEMHGYHNQELGIRGQELGIRGEELGLRRKGEATQEQRLRLERERLTDTERTSKETRKHTQAETALAQAKLGQAGKGGAKGTTPVQTATAVRGAMGQLKTMFGMDPPGDDPHFDEVLTHFATNPGDREHMLQDPAMPQNTKQYLSRLRNMIP
jgi:hypothetical protein